MSDMIQRVFKRHHWPVTIHGDQFYVRALSHGETVALKNLEPELQNTFVIASSLVDDTGASLFPRQAGESHEAYGRRMLTALDELPNDTSNELIDAISKATNPPKMEKLAKN